MPYSWTHLVRFLAKEDGQVHLGQIDAAKVPDLGLALEKGETVTVQVVEGDVFDGVVTNRTLTISTVSFGLLAVVFLTPWLTRALLNNCSRYCAKIRCPLSAAWDSTTATTPRRPACRFQTLHQAADGAGRPVPARIVVPKIAQDGTSDYEAELSLVIGKTGRDIPKEQALDYMLGYTASNDVSARAHTDGTGLDASAPIGPVLVAASAIVDPHRLKIKAILNGEVVQNSNTSEMIFDIPTTIAFLSQGTTLERGTIIMTGTGPGIGAMRTPKLSLKHEDDIRVEIEKIGTLINKVYHE
ncbi:fumarylacetoacetate hydrolase family protein [Grosmannia clavigera kw1407]|uniref:Fumarylacetoacetate hydrolase family protein n=1 Tax=Grosmannia clavigera (strain kw1407 / UAMH 11150) TaxID=655863 RepID=F0X8Q2_GROCL|nr:fumarylacetoacetate hydrolase family protein [Grosmannia clavigera kw1407]EFX06129.1 fumarylacetoacetate hydrolase family protein [Grosmannia clavigera kw1407]